MTFLRILKMFSLSKIKSSISDYYPLLFGKSKLRKKSTMLPIKINADRIIPRM